MRLVIHRMNRYGNHYGQPRLAAEISDGNRRAVVSWDRHRFTYRAEIELFAVPASTPKPEPFQPDWPGPSSASTVSSWSSWDWLDDPRPGVLPERMVIGDRLAELITVDSLLDRLVTMRFDPDPDSRQALFALRSLVEIECGSVFFVGQIGANGIETSPSVSRELALGLPDGRHLTIVPRFNHSDYGFGWGVRGEATIRTAQALVDGVWSRRRNPPTEAAVIDLAVSILANVRGSFVWRAESVADWIATEAGELANRPKYSCSSPLWPGEDGQFRQLYLDFR